MISTDFQSFISPNCLWGTKACGSVTKVAHVCAADFSEIWLSHLWYHSSWPGILTEMKSTASEWGKKNKTPPLGSTETKMQHLSAMTGGANEIHSCLFVFISNQIKWFDQNFKLKPRLVFEAVRWLCTIEFIKIAAIWVSIAIIHCQINSSDCRGSLKYWDFLLIDCGS